MVATNDWKKKCVGLQRTRVSKRTVNLSVTSVHFFCPRNNSSDNVLMKPLVEGLIGDHVMRVNKMARTCLTKFREKMVFSMYIS